MAPRVGFEPTTNRLTAGCSTTELPRIIAHAPSTRLEGEERVSIKFGAGGKGPVFSIAAAQIKRGPLAGPSKALGMVGCLQGKTA